MVRDALLILLLLGLTRLLLTAVRRAHLRFSFSSELSRKLLHIGMGLLLTPLPWIFRSIWPVAVLSGIYVGLLIARRLVPALDRQVASIIYGVDRRSIGEFLFPVTVLALFVLTPGDHVGFVAPMLLLTFADAAAAIVGRRWGLCTYLSPAGRKSLEGSLAFCIVALLCVVFVLITLGVPESTGRMLLIAASVALGMTFVEAAGPCGFDNTLVPLGALAMLRPLATFSTERLSIIAAAEAGIALTLVMAWSLLGARRESPAPALAEPAE